MKSVFWGLPLMNGGLKTWLLIYSTFIFIKSKAELWSIRNSLNTLFGHWQRICHWRGLLSSKSTFIIVLMKYLQISTLFFKTFHFCLLSNVRVLAIVSSYQTNFRLFMHFVSLKVKKPFKDLKSLRLECR